MIVAVDQALDDLTKLRSTLTEAVVRAHRDTDTGFSAGGSSEAVSQSSIPDRATAEHALAILDRPDAVAQNAAKLVHAIGAAKAMSEMALRCARNLVPMDREHAQKLAAEIAGGPSICANTNCQANVWRTANDRLRAGRCSACYQWRIRHDGTERPKDLCDQDAARGSRRPRAVVSSA